MKHVVGFSGGIDSQACALWVRRRFPAEDVILLNSNAGGNESAVTTQFIADYSRDVFPVITIIPMMKDLQGVGSKDGGTRDRRASHDPEGPLTFDTLAHVKGRFPARKSQFCTKILKLEPQKRWLEENLPFDPVERYSGVRRDESESRKDSEEREWDEYFDCYLNRPLASWTKKQCFDYVTEAGEQFNPLYKMGFSRVGCAPCINSGKEDILLWHYREPAMIEKVREWEARVKRPFFPPMVPGLEINWIDEVIAWAKTSHGGKQLALPFIQMEAEAGVCSSKYGLCE